MGGAGISKRDLSTLTGINHNSVVKWRKIYTSENIEPLLKHGRLRSYKKSTVSPEDHKQIKKILNNLKNGIRGYLELLEWVSMERQKEIFPIYWIHEIAMCCCAQTPMNFS